MIDSVLVENIWHQAGVTPAYLEAIRQICLPTDSSSSPETLDQLPLLFCELNGGDEQQIIPIITAWTLLRHAARLLDDIEDGDVKSRDISEAIALNNSTGFLFTVGMVLNSLEIAGLPPNAANDIRRMFYEELLKVCSGQHLDLTRSSPTLEECWQIVGTKSGVFVGLICWAGGRVANAKPEQLELYRQFGYNLGVLDQIRDDLADLWADESHHSDLRNANHYGLPITYALSVLPKNERQKLLAYLENVKELEAEKKARELIIRSGAGAYLAVQSACYYQQSQQLLAQMTLPAKALNNLTILLKKARLPTIEA